MIFQEWVKHCCDARPAEAYKRIEAAGGSGLLLGYQRIYRWYRTPTPLSLALARVVVKASEGKCTLEELTDADAIGLRFEFDSADAASERRLLAQRIERCERELRQLESLVTRSVDERRTELKQLRGRLARVATDAPQRKQGRPPRAQSEPKAKRKPRAA